MCVEEILSIICISVSSVIYSGSLLLRNKKNILITQICSSVLYVGSYIFALLINESAKIGVITASFELLRLIVYYLIDKKENVSKIWKIIAASMFSLAITITTVLTEPSLLCLLVLIGAILVSFALSSKNVLFIKLACVVQALGIIVYLFLLGLLFNAISQVFVLVMGSIGLINYMIKLRKENKLKKERN